MNNSSNVKPKKKGLMHKESKLSNEEMNSDLRSKRLEKKGTF